MKACYQLRLNMNAEREVLKEWRMIFSDLVLKIFFLIVTIQKYRVEIMKFLLYLFIHFGLEELTNDVTHISFSFAGDCHVFSCLTLISRRKML